MASETPEITKSCFKERKEVQNQGQSSRVAKKPRLTYEDRLAKAREVRTIKCRSNEKIPPEDEFLNEDSLDEKILPDKKCVNLDIRLAVLERRLVELKEKARIKEREIRRALELSRKRKEQECSFLNGFSVRRSSHRKHPMAKLKKQSSKAVFRKDIGSTPVQKELEEKLQPRRRKKQSSKAVFRKDICSSPVQKELEEKLQPQVKIEPVDTQKNLSTLAADFSMTPVGSSHVQDVQVKTEPLEVFEKTPTPISDPLNPVKLFHPSLLEAVPGENSSNWDYMVMEIEVEPDESVESLFTLVQNQRDKALFQECEQAK